MSPGHRSQVMRNCYGIEEVMPSVINFALTCPRTEEFMLTCAAAGLDLTAPGIRKIFKFKFNWERISSIAKAELDRLKSME